MRSGTPWRALFVLRLRLQHPKTQQQLLCNWEWITDPQPALWCLITQAGKSHHQRACWEGEMNMKLKIWSTQKDAELPWVQTRVVMALIDRHSRAPGTPSICDHSASCGYTLAIQFALERRCLDHCLWEPQYWTLRSTPHSYLHTRVLCQWQ